MPNAIDKIANALYLSGCLRFGSFKIKSGATSPYYIDLARVLSVPQQLCVIAEVASEKIKQIMASERIDKLASIELKGALIAPSIACNLNMPCVIVRKDEKAYGVTGRIAGADVAKGDSILFFDDVISEGISKIEGIKPLQELGANVKHLLVVVNREQGGKEKLEKLGYKVHALAKISEIVDSLNRDKHISKEQADKVLDYIKNLQLL
ncbi:MAG TPA: orotate phosphoribosyltransferase [Candidatus Binatia bacterium]|nr:orotate phosphoribosyltransferase [Candidatus Binatia bacterium]